MTLTTGEVLREALVVFGRHCWRYLLLVTLVYVPIRVLDALIPSAWDLLASPVDIIGVTVAEAAVARAVLSASELRGIGLRAYRMIWPFFWRLAAFSLIAALAVVFGLLLLIVPGLLLIARWSVCIPAIIAERDSVLGFGRSVELTAGHRWIGLWVVLVPAVVSLLFIGPTIVLRSQVIAWATFPLSLVLVTYGAVAAAVLYRRLVSFEVA